MAAERINMGAISYSGDAVFRTVCPMKCGTACGILAHVIEGKLVKVEPAGFPELKYRHICGKALSLPRLVYHPDRLKYPLKRVGPRGGGGWQRISWHEALDTVAARLHEISAKNGPASVAWCVAPMGALPMAYRRFADAGKGTWISTIGFGDSAAPCADAVSYGKSFRGREEGFTSKFDDPRLCVFWGANDAETHIHGCRAAFDARERGARIVVIDPRFTPTAAKADEWLPIRPGTDAALALGMINVIINRGLQDDSFLARHTAGPLLVRTDNGRFLRQRDIPGEKSADGYVMWDIMSSSHQPADSAGVSPALRGSYSVGGLLCKPAFQLLAELAAGYPLEKAAEITEVSAEAIERLALEYGSRKPVNSTVSSNRGMGCQRTFHGDTSFRAITTLAAVTGNINLHGRSELNLNWAPFVSPVGAVRSLPIMNMYQNILSDKPDAIKAMWIAHENLVNQLPNAGKIVKELFPRLDFIVAVDMFMTATAQHADIVLPACSFVECVDLVPSYGHPYLQLQQKVIEPLHESMSDFDILSQLAPRMGLAQYFDKSAEEFMEMLLTLWFPSGERVTLEKLRQGAVRLPPHTSASFTTPSGRLEFYSERLLQFGQELPVHKEPFESRRQPLAAKYPLSFMQTHTRYRVHSMFSNVDWLKDLDPEPVLEMNPVDARSRGIEDGDTVAVFNDRGKMKIKARVHEGIRPGVVNSIQGWWPKHFVEGSHQDLTHDAVNPAQEAIFESNAAFYDVLVEVQKVRGD